MRKRVLKKTAVVAVAAIMLVQNGIAAFASATVTQDERNGKISYKGSSANSVISRFDGETDRLKNVAVSGDTAESAYSYVKNDKVKLMSFSDLSTATAAEDERVINSDVLFRWDGELYEDTLNVSDTSKIVVGQDLQDTSYSSYTEQVTYSSVIDFQTSGTNGAYIETGDGNRDFLTESESTYTVFDVSFALQDYTGGSTANCFTGELYDKSGNTQKLFATSITKSGTIFKSYYPAITIGNSTTKTYTSSTSGEKGVWYRVAAVVDENDKTITTTLYTNGYTANATPTAQATVTESLTLSDIAKYRVTRNNYNSQKFAFTVDNLFVYSGATPRDLEDSVFREYVRDGLAKNASHPRLFATQSDFDRIKATYTAGTDKYIKNWGDDVITAADKYLAVDIAADKTFNKATGIYLIGATSDGDSYLWSLSMAYQLTGDTKYSDKAVEIMKYLATTGSVSVNGTADFTYWTQGNGLDMPEIGTYVAAAYDICYNAISASDRTVIENAINTKLLNPVRAAFTYDDSKCETVKINGVTNGLYKLAVQEYAGTLKNSNNHRLISNAAAAIGAMAIADVIDDEEWIIAEAIANVDDYVPHFKNGSYWEGIGYTELTVEYLIYLMASMNNMLGNTATLAEHGFSLTKIAEFIMDAQSSVGIQNTGDAAHNWTTTHMYTPEMLWIGNYYNDSTVVSAVAENKDKFFNENSDNALALMWYNPDLNTSGAARPNQVEYDADEQIYIKNSYPAAGVDDTSRTYLARYTYDDPATAETDAKKIATYVEIVDGNHVIENANLFLDPDDKVAHITGNSELFYENSGTWNSQHVTYEMDVYFTNTWKGFDVEFYGGNNVRYGMKFDAAGTTNLKTTSRNSSGTRVEYDTGIAVTRHNWHNLAIDVDHTTGTVKMYWDEQLVNTYTDAATGVNVTKALQFRLNSQGTSVYSDSNTFINNFQIYDGGFRRDNATKSESFLAVHGGTSRISHGQIDGGSFIYDWGGVRWAADLGAENYTATNIWEMDTDENDLNRFRYFRNMAASHNTIEVGRAKVNGTSYSSATYGQDLDANVSVNLVNYNDTSAIATADMTAALAANVNSAKRGFMMTDDRQSLVVRDEISLKSTSTPINWNLIMGQATSLPSGGGNSMTFSNEFDIQKNSDTSLLITHKRTRKQMKLDFVVTGGSGVTTVRTADEIKTLVGACSSSVAEDDTVRHIDFEVTPSSADVTITAKFTPVGAFDTTDVSKYAKAISSWTLK